MAKNNVDELVKWKEQQQMKFKPENCEINAL